MKNNITLILILLFSLVFMNCTSKPRFNMENTKGGSAVESAKISGDVIVDENGKEFYKEKIEPHYGKFRWIKNRKVPVYADDSKFAEPVTYAYSHEFVEIVDGRLGLDLSKIRIFNKERGYVEGYTKNHFLFATDYYSEPYEFTEMEILRRKELDEQKQKREEERRKKNLEMQKQKEYSIALQSARTDNKSVMRMTYQQLSAYLTPSYTEDLVYTQNSTRTLKFTKGTTALYFSMEEGQVIGIHAVNNADGFSSEQSNVFLFETIGEIFYSVEDVENINKFIIRKTGIMERTEYPVSMKFDNTKENPITEITIGNFTGIE